MRFLLLFALLMGNIALAGTSDKSNSHLSSNPPAAIEKTSVESDTKVEEFAEDAFEDEFADEFADNEFDEEFGDDTQEEIFDPLSGYNRVMTSFNNGLFDYVLDPFLIKGYNYIPEPARDSVYNFFENLYFPVSVVNNLFQLKFKNSGLKRFVLL